VAAVAVGEEGSADRLVDEEVGEVLEVGVVGVEGEVEEEEVEGA